MCRFGVSTMVITYFKYLCKICYQYGTRWGRLFSYKIIRILTFLNWVLRCFLHFEERIISSIAHMFIGRLYQNMTSFSQKYDTAIYFQQNPDFVFQLQKIMIMNSHHLLIGKQALENGLKERSMLIKRLQMINCKHRFSIKAKSPTKQCIFHENLDKMQC